MGIDLSASTEGPVEPTTPATPIIPPATEEPKLPPKVKSSKAKASSKVDGAAADASVASPKKTTRKPAAKKKPAAKTAASKKPAAKRPAKITRDHIAIRAFIVWEKRSQQGLPGDEISDWVEAERQLLAERSNGA